MPEPKDKVYRSKKTIFIDNLIGGIAWGIGGTIGLAVVFVVFGIIVKNANLVPFIGDLLIDVNKYVVQKNPQFSAPEN